MNRLFYWLLNIPICSVMCNAKSVTSSLGWWLISFSSLTNHNFHLGQPLPPVAKLWSSTPTISMTDCKTVWIWQASFHRGFHNSFSCVLSGGCKFLWKCERRPNRKSKSKMAIAAAAWLWKMRCSICFSTVRALILIISILTSLGRSYIQFHDFSYLLKL